jgi:hypothetical protein
MSRQTLFGYEYWGVNPANGNPVYYKADGSLVQTFLRMLIEYLTANPNTYQQRLLWHFLTEKSRKYYTNLLEVLIQV